MLLPKTRGSFFPSDAEAGRLRSGAVCGWHRPGPLREGELGLQGAPAEGTNGGRYYMIQ